MVAVPEQRPSGRTLDLIQGSMSSARVARRSPVLGSLHRVADGTLLGVLTATAVLAGLTLHWQHRWTVAFNQLESTRTLAHRLTESTALLEQHVLRGTSQPQRLVPTKASNLIHLDRPKVAASTPTDSDLIETVQSLLQKPIRPGY
ncbi:hypothetical protein [Parasynechococcus sp.]|uniref:hypothetical protein n=1 Tax=Parasynechococcus sp. TaxID=3101203 RepID=UPI003704B764